ncbi:MAG: hypothetical protein AAF996_03055 [Pseudomonadota bacterium]
MKPLLLLLAAGAFLLPASAQMADTAEGRMAQCIAQVTEASEKAGAPEKDPKAVCDCLSAGMAENEALRAEVTVAKGLPAPGEASEEMVELIHSCRAKTSES